MDKIKKAVIGGSVAPLLMFLAWNTVILGSVSKDAGLVAEAAGGVFDPLQVRGCVVRRGAAYNGTFCRMAYACRCGFCRMPHAEKCLAGG